MARPWRGPGRRREGSGHPSPGRRRGTRRSRSRRCHSPALGLLSDRASWPAPPWGDTDAAVSAGHLDSPAPEIPVPEASGAGPRANTACGRPRPGSGPPSWGLSGLQGFSIPSPSLPRFGRFQPQLPCRGRQPGSSTRRFTVPQLRKIGKH